jgi:hypothetical protein
MSEGLDISKESLGVSVIRMHLRLFKILDQRWHLQAIVGGITVGVNKGQKFQTGATSRSKESRQQHLGVNKLIKFFPGFVLQENVDAHSRPLTALRGTRLSIPQQPL